MERLSEAAANLIFSFDNFDNSLISLASAALSKL
jgi:hypothetical protein